MSNLYLIRGLPGSGKSTFAPIVCENILSADQYHTDKHGNYNFDSSKVRESHEWCQERTRRFLEREQDIAVANTFTQEWEMAPYFAMAKKYGTTVYTIVVENRHGSKSIHGVPADKIEMMKNRFEVKL